MKWYYPFVVGFVISLLYVGSFYVFNAIGIVPGDAMLSFLFNVFWAPLFTLMNLMLGDMWFYANTLGLYSFDIISGLWTVVVIFTIFIGLMITLFMKITTKKSGGRR